MLSLYLQFENVSNVYDVYKYINTYLEIQNKHAEALAVIQIISDGNFIVKNNASKNIADKAKMCMIFVCMLMELFSGVRYMSCFDIKL